MNTIPKLKSDVESPKSAIVALLLCIFLGGIGIHRFYVGKIGTGILMLLTGGGLGIWVLVDIILIASCEFKDKQGRRLVFKRGEHSPLRLILITVGSILAVLILYASLLTTLVLYATSGLTDTARQQLDAIRSGNLEKAYAEYTTDQFKQNTSLEQFKQFVESHPALKNNKNASFNSREFTNDIGRLSGTLTAQDGETSPIEYQLVKVQDQWKINGIRIPTLSTDVSTQKTFNDKQNKFSIKYPNSWTYEQPNTKTVVFSGQKGTPSYFSTIVIQVVPAKQNGGIYETRKEALKHIKEQISNNASNVQIVDQGVVNLSHNPTLYGEYFVISYDFKGKSIRKMQFVISKKDAKDFYSWAYTAPEKDYFKDLPIAKAIFESWVIE